MRIRDAAHLTVHNYPGGSLSLAPRLGIAASSLREKVNPHRNDKSLTLEETDRLMHITGNHEILRAMCEEHGYLPPILMPECIVSDEALLEQYANLITQLGEFSSAFNVALKDGRITKREVARMRKEMMDFFAAGATLMNRIEQIAE